MVNNGMLQYNAFSFQSSLFESDCQDSNVVGIAADKCPAGCYCPEQTSEPFPCPQGTYSPSTGLTRESECLNCTAGYFCNSTGKHLQVLRR